MDPITMAIITALAKLGETVINDSYQALKGALQHKYGVDSGLVEAMHKLEEKPDSVAHKEMLREEVEAAKADQDSELLKIAQALLDKLIEDQPQSPTNIKQQAGDNAIQVGQVSGDVNLNR